MNARLSALVSARLPGALLRLLPVVFASATLACTDGAAEDDAADTDDEGSDEGPALGDTPLPACEAAMFSLAQIEAELRLPSPDLDYLIELYRGDAPDLSGESPTPGGTAVQRWVREVGARLGRVEAGTLVDDAAIEAALDEATALDGDARKLALLDVLARLRLVALLDVRSRLAVVADALPDPLRDPALHEAEWDAAWCVWDGALHGLADAAGEDWEPTIVAAFEAGLAGIRGPEQDWATDEFATKPSKQVVEKGSFGVVARRLVGLAEAARAGDGFAAREALGLFALIEDRIAGRNTPAIATIEAMLAGEPSEIDPDAIAEALAVAFVKRARKYCDEALLAGSTGSAEGVKGVEEGVLYTKVILPQMQAALAGQGFDGEAYLSAWADYREAVVADDGGRANELSATLIEWNCAFQLELGIPTCTDSADEL